MGVSVIRETEGSGSEPGADRACAGFVSARTVPQNLHGICHFEFPVSFFLSLEYATECPGQDV